jgi:vacuolar-type H+-ATPase subunit I/STV1
VLDLNPGEEADDHQMDEGEGDDANQRPTLMQTTKFTKAFNSVVETYAVASYGEGSRDETTNAVVYFFFF